MIEMIEQGSEAWFQSRLGKLTASRVHEAITKTKTGYVASREDVMNELALERITGNKTPSFVNSYMEWGTATEPLARAAYESRTGFLVEEVPMIDHPTIDMSGASPDGLVQEGLIEIKCPKSTTHLETLTSKKIPSKYQTQMNWQMACTGRPWVDFASFDPRFPERLQLCVIRHERDDKVIAAMEEEVIKFLTELDAMVKQLNEME